MEHLFIRKINGLEPEFDLRTFLSCIPVFCGIIAFAVVRNQTVGFIAERITSVGISVFLAAAVICVLLLFAAFSEMLSAAAVVIIPCICALGGFAVCAASYAYAGESFLLFAFLVFAYIVSLLFVSVTSMKLSKSLQGIIRSNRSFRIELTRYRLLFVLIVFLLIVSGYFILK